VTRDVQGGLIRTDRVDLVDDHPAGIMGSITTRSDAR
jgi:hypothetical protein